MKRGLQHVEAIISFVLFIGFLVVALLFFNPLDTTRVLDSSLNYAFDEVSNNISVEVESYSVVFEEDFGGFGFVGGYIPLSPTIGAEGVIVEDANGALVDESSYGYSSGRVYLSDPGFYVVKFSDAYSGGSLTSGSEIDDYEIASSDIQDVWSISKFNELVGFYENDYNQVRTNFNLPGRVGFSFAIVFSNGSIITPDSEVPQDLEVFSKRERSKIIMEDGSTEFVDLLVNVW